MKIYEYRRWLCLIIPVIMIITLGIKIRVNYINSIVKTDVVAYSDKEYQDIFEKRTNASSVKSKNCNFSFSNNFKEAEILLTSDISKIDTKQDYSTIAYSPLVFLMKDSENLNNFLESKTKSGFLISETEIENKETDKISCNFNKVVDAVVTGKNWSSLGGGNKSIRIYYPSLDTLEGKEFKEFLIRSFNNGSNKNPSKSIEEKINQFFSSPNLISIDNMKEKLEKLGNDINENELYVVFEDDILQAIDKRGYFRSSEHMNISFIYPEITILKEIYFQNKNPNLKEVSKSLCGNGEKGIMYVCYRDLRYKMPERTNFYNSIDEYYNVQWGVNSFS